MKPFHVLVNCPFVDLVDDDSLSPIDKKYCLSLVNGFEDGHWQNKYFMEFVWDNVKETALSKKEREALAGNESSMLDSAAANLRITDDDVTGGEIAEILLYGVMKHYYGALPIVPKIFYKQNKNDFAKGADCVHIVIEEDGSFSLWLGEAKFYTTLDSSNLDKVVKSVHNTLSTEQIKKENTIITNISDLYEFEEISEDLRNYIIHVLRASSIDVLKPHLHIPILLLHQCQITGEATEQNEEYLMKLKDAYKQKTNAYFAKQIDGCRDVFKYSDITFHLILIPVPDKKDIVTKFKKRADVYRK